MTAEPGTLEFLRQLLEIAQSSDHPMDKALTKVLEKQIGEYDQWPAAWNGVTIDADTNEWIPSSRNVGENNGA